MKLKASAGKQGASAAKVHRRVVGLILSQPLPAGRLFGAKGQWSGWLLISLLSLGLAAMAMGVQAGVERISRHPGLLALLALAVSGVAMASWEAVASSVPGRETGGGYKAALALVLAALAATPFWLPGFDEGPQLTGGMGCAMQVSMLGVPPWMALGWTLSRNASLSPAWAGACSGISAFLIAAIAVQLHCPNWSPGHFLLAHLLPVAAAAAAATFFGARWFSRWEK